MSRSILKSGLPIILLLTVIVSITFAAEDQGQQNQWGQWGQWGQQWGQGRQMGRGGFDLSALLEPGAIEKRILDYYKQQLKPTEEEWKILEPRLNKVLQLNQDTQPGSITGMIRQFTDRLRRTQGEAKNEEEKTEKQNAVQKAMTELQDTLNKEAPSSAEIRAKIAAYKGAKEKAKQELLQAQKELTEVLTLKQEAVLLMLGVLD